MHCSKCDICLLGNISVSALDININAISDVTNECDCVKMYLKE